MHLIDSIIAIFLAAATLPTLPSKVTFLGVDFRHAAFYDEHILKERAVNTRSGESEPISDLIHGKIPSWNRETCIFFGKELGSHSLAGMATDVDFSISAAGNGEVTGEAVKWIPPSRKDVAPLSDDLLAREIEPYLLSSTDAGLLLVVDQINKEEGVIAHYILFRRSDGSVIKTERFRNKASGVGIRNYYLNGLKRTIKDVIHSVKSLR